MSGPEEEYRDPHGECAAEIHRLHAQLKRSVSITCPDGELRPLDDILKEAVLLALAHEPNIAALTRKIEVGRSTLYRWLHLWGIGVKAPHEC